ncbi:MAG: hydrogenase maturation nickel metallochaperone HypA [Polyangiaceae bacterium]|nr:hydrogenase maturation nickel metallochaperone HypA [Polyangiaceae bacterium]
MVQTAVETARGRRVVQVDLQVGELSGVSAEAVEFCFAACTQGTELDGAKLVITRIAGEGRCGACGKVFPVGPFNMVEGCCPGAFVQILRGEELVLSSLVLETP